MAVKDVLDTFLGGPTGQTARNRQEEEARLKCERQGGQWINGQCVIAPKEEAKPTQPAEAPKPVEQKPLTPQEKSAAQAAGNNIIRDAQGNEIIQTKDDIEKQRALNETPGLSAAQAVEQNKLIAQQQAEGAALAGQVGQFQQEQIGGTPLLDWREALTTGIVDSIPRALSLAVTGAGVGLAGGAVAGVGVGAPAGAAIGAAAGFTAGISSGMISNFKEQRRDTTTAQKQALTEGKQNMQEAITSIRADPGNKALYLRHYNQQVKEIDKAYRQMKLDTSRDVAKFETALPDLGEFNDFYSKGGEYELLQDNMRAALLTPVSVEYEYLKLADKYGDKKNE